MSRLFIRLTAAVLACVSGVYVTVLLNRAAYNIWPDVDPQPRIVVDSAAKKPCVGVSWQFQQKENPEGQSTKHKAQKTKHRSG
jgi:hypothetical protein